MRKRIARKIYFPKDVPPVYRPTTMDRAFRRLRLGNPAKWKKAREHRDYFVWHCAARKTLARVEFEP